MDKDIQQIPIVEYRSEKARELADIASIILDLRAILDSCKRLLQLMDSDSDDQVLLESLWTSALVRYVRCFSHGKREGLRTDILDELIDGAREVHQFFKDIRDKHISHSVNPFEQVKVGVVLTPREGADRKVEGISTLHIRQLASSREGVETLFRLVYELEKEVSERGKELQSQVMEEARELSVEELEQGSVLGLTAPDSGEAGKART